MQNYSSVHFAPNPLGHKPVCHCNLGVVVLTCEHLMWSLLKEFLKFSKQEKKWWLIPLIVVLLLLGAILIFTSSSGIAWALYPFL